MVKWNATDKGAIAPKALVCQRKINVKNLVEMSKHSTMTFPMEIDIFLNFLKVKIFSCSFMIWKRLFFLKMMQNCPNFSIDICFHIFCYIFAKFFAKKCQGEVWQVWNLVCSAGRSCREKKVHNTIFVSPWSKYLPNIFYQFFHQTNIW